MAKYAEDGEWAALEARVGWVVRRGDDEQRLDERLPRLLAAMAQATTLVAAARATGIAYRTAWAIIEEAGREIGAPLLASTRGRGATLTPLGAKLLAAHERATAAAAKLPRLPVRGRSVERASGEAEAPLRVAASHDVALAQLRDHWRLAHGVVLDFHGSAESLDAWHAGSADVAGFHVERGARRGSDPLLARIDARRDALISFITRTQGLIVPRGNPRRLRTLAQVAARGLVFVNRQPGSGTRLLLDRLLARARLDPSRLRGYSTEEFTHAAVAATVAAGRADAGLGIAAAAAQFGLAFVPLVTERYLFACRRRALGTPRLRAFRALLASEATRAAIAPLPGYAPDHPGVADEG